MSKVLVVLDDPDDVEALAAGHGYAKARDAELAVCVRLAVPTMGLAHLQLQRKLTSRMREALGHDAEQIAVFVVEGVPGDDVGSCATAWGATEVFDPRRD